MTENRIIASNWANGDIMLIHFTFNDGDGVVQDGTHDFKDLDGAKRDALLALVQSLQDEADCSGEFLKSVAGVDGSGVRRFYIQMHVVIEESPARSFPPTV
ncbi:MAG: hypothetical protein ACOH2J_01600 [Allorhizobium sp.]